MISRLKEKDGPTPELGKPKKNSNIFTYSENKLLDQITVEIMESWKADLSMMKQHYKETLKTCKSIKNVTEDFEESFSKINEMLTSKDFLSMFENLKGDIEEIKLRQIEMDKNIIEIQKKLEYPDIKALMKYSKTIEELAKSINEKVEKNNPKKWWKRILGY